MIRLFCDHIFIVETPKTDINIDKRCVFVVVINFYFYICFQPTYKKHHEKFVCP